MSGSEERTTTLSSFKKPHSRNYEPERSERLVAEKGLRVLTRLKSFNPPCCCELEEVGYMYFNARYYDPEVGRFLTEDPSRKGTSWYTYCSNNPLTFTDPTGRREIIDEDEYGRPVYADPREERKERERNRRERAERERREISPADPNTFSNYIGINLTVTNPIQAAANLLNTIQDFLTGYDPEKRDWFPSRPDVVAVSGGIYVQSQSIKLGGRIPYNIPREAGLYGTVGAGGGSPNISIGLEAGISHTAPSTLFGGRTTEIGGSIAFVGISVMTDEHGRIIGSEGSFDISPIPVEFHLIEEISGYVPIFSK